MQRHSEAGPALQQQIESYSDQLELSAEGFNTKYMIKGTVAFRLNLSTNEYC